MREISATEKKTILRKIFDKICCQSEGVRCVENIREGEEKCIQEIVDKIWQVRSIVGIESRVKEIKSLLRIGFGGVYFVGVCGISGSGKTTVARAIFDEISCQFEGSCFLATVGEVSEKHGLSHLKQKLLSQISMQAFVDVESVAQRLASHEALELFSWHAFQQRAPVKEFEELSNCVVDCAKGLPLALEVMGSFLYKRGMEELRSGLHRFKDLGNGKIVKLLSLSLDAWGSKRMIEMHDSIAQMGQQVARAADQSKPWNCAIVAYG
ncbi:disease resistance protein Roq1-like [Nicotiana tabacum]|uniref:Disease resistance protein Roq1-like n=1 Tax=Nicotiana tabacum TaxID=4097 RepID=A0AC58RUW5_TOBAC